MQKFLIPVSFPFGVINEDQVLHFDIDTNILRATPKKDAVSTAIKVHLKREILTITDDINHGGIIIPKKVASNYFQLGFEPIDKIRLAIFEVEADKDAFEKELKFELAIFLLAVLNIFGHARVSPLVQDDSGQTFFNSQLAYLISPGQDWFGQSFRLSTHADRRIYNQMPAPKAADYPVLQEYLATSLTPIDWKKIGERNESLSNKEVVIFGKVLSEVTRQHIGIDYVSIIGTLTAFIEGILEIEGEHAYKFSIKISNLFKDARLAPILKKIYKIRSSYFHSAILTSPNNYFELTRIEFLLLVIRRIVMHDFDTPITVDSFDFPL